MSKAVLPILNKVMLGEMKPESASRLIAVWYGEIKNATCALDYLQDKCFIFKIGNEENTFENGCKKCGHYRKIV
jgi:hypothetical protein